MSNYTPQAAAIVVKDGNICIVSTSGGKGWVVPKGHLRRGTGLHETAAIEAWEEAGVKGKVIPEPVGEFTYKKKGESFHVTAFEIKVSEISANWPEQDKRRRRWIRIDEAAGEVRYRQLREILADLAAQNAGNGARLQDSQVLVNAGVSQQSY
jgi:8-oxo-dGTP pyrophosphatase MutT (NUDIX family)